MTGGSKMFEALVDALRVVHFGVATNFWGLGCPAHCRGADVGSLAASFLLGFLLASCGALLLGYHWILRVPEPAVPRPTFLDSPTSVHRRLRGYLHG